MLIKGICCRFNDQQQVIWSVVQAKKRVSLLVQSEHLSINKYYEEFKTLVAVVETYGGTFVKPGMIEKELTFAGMTLKQNAKGNDLSIMDLADKSTLDVSTRIAREKILALMLLNGANYKRYAEVCNQLANQFTQDTNRNPKTIEISIHLLNNYKPLRPMQTFMGRLEEEDIAFS